jgi:K+-sensing histidine kinase KdpD
MGIVGTYLDRKLQDYPRLRAAKNRVIAEARAHVALHQAVAGMPPGNIDSVTQFMRERGILELIGKRKGQAHNLLMTGLMFEETFHKFGGVIQSIVDSAEFFNRHPDLALKYFSSLKSVSEMAVTLFNLIKSPMLGIKSSSYKPYSLIDQLNKEVNEYNNIYGDRCRAVLSTIGDLDKTKTNMRQTQLKLSIFNLLLNSGQHGSSHIEIYVDSIAPDKLRIRIIDNGEGFDQMVRAKIATPAFTTKGDHGHGFGTSIAKSIIEESGGTIDWNSPGPGKGCVVNITLPAESDPRHTRPG